MSDLAACYGDREPSANVEAEQAVLGSMLIEQQAVESVLALDPPMARSEFWRPAHQAIYDAMLSLRRRGLAIDVVTLSDTLRTDGLLASIGGADYLCMLMEAVASAASILHYVGIVRAHAASRRICDAARAISEVGWQEHISAADKLSRIHLVLSDLQGLSCLPRPATIAQTVEAVRDAIESRAMGLSNDLTGISTGIYRLDRLTDGWARGDLIIVGGRPSMGKTQIALQMALSAALHDLHVAIVSLEMSREQLVTRLIALRARLDMMRMRRGDMSPAECERFYAAADVIAGLPIYIDDSGADSAVAIQSRCCSLHAQSHVDMVIVDYLQMMAGAAGAAGAGGDGDNRSSELSGITRSLKRLARELNAPVIALSQLSRRLEQRADRRPILSDLRDSGGIESDADVVLFPYRDGYYRRPDGDTMPPMDDAELIVAKARNGPTGTVAMLWDNVLGRYESPVSGAPPAPPVETECAPPQYAML